MNAIQLIRQWCSDNGHTFCYGNPYHVEEWMGNTDFSQSADETAVYTYLLTSSRYVDQHDTYDVGIFFASLIPFDFDNQSIDTVTEDLKELSKGLLAYIHAGNLFGWSDARWQYGYDDYAENVAWCCLRVTLTALAADCLPLPMPEPPAYDMIPLPDVAAEFIRQFSGGQYEGTIRDNVLADTLANGSITVVFIGVSQSPPHSGEVDVYVTLNGVRNHIGTETPAVVTEESVELYPQLAPYIGYFLYEAFYSEVSEETEFCAVVEFEGVYTSPEVCWEEVP